MAAVSAKVKYVSESSDQTCPVCFKDAEIFSVGLCDHPICHECSTRMRVLCKEDACPICRREMPKVEKHILACITRLNTLFDRLPL